MTDDTTNIKQLASIFPYVMLVVCFFLVGFVFLLINGPLAFELLMRSEHNNFQELILSGILQNWLKIYQAIPGGSFVFLFSFSALVAGFAVNAFAQTISLVLGSSSAIISVRVHRPQHFFTVKDFTSSDYARFSAWLMRNRTDKLQWEWELFNYYFYWGLSANVLLFFLVTSMILESANVLLFLAWLAVTGYSLGRSMTMGNFHRHCLGQLGDLE